MREILFRGKSVNTGEWIIGDYEHFYLSDGELVVYISEWGKRNDKVLPNTVGQYTGLTDKNGKKIFEGDIVRLYHSDGFEEIGAIGWSNIDVRYKFASSDGFAYGIDVTDVFEVIGNIHDNPELLKGE